MLSQFHFCMDLRVKGDIRLETIPLGYYVGQIGRGLEVHTEINAL